MSWWVQGEADLAEKQVEWDAVLQAYSGKSGVGWIRARCPMCEQMSGSDDIKESLGFNTKTSGYNCMKCEAHGRLPKSYSDRLGDLVVADQLGSPDDSTPLQGKPEPAPGFVELFSEQGLAQPWLDSVRAYVLDPPSVRVGPGRGQPCRGIPREVAAEMGLGTGTGKITGRVVVPIRDLQNPDGPWLGWYGRDSTGTARVAHLYAKGMVREGLLWNSEQIGIETSEPLFVVEGCLKAVPIWPNAVATLGKPLASHLAPLLRSRRPIVVCLDGDAWREGQKLAWDLKMRGISVQNLQLSPKTDPDDMTRDWLLQEASRLLRNT